MQKPWTTLLHRLMIPCSPALDQQAGQGFWCIAIDGCCGSTLGRHVEGCTPCLLQLEKFWIPYIGMCHSAASGPSLRFSQCLELVMDYGSLACVRQLLEPLAELSVCILAASAG